MGKFTLLNNFMKKIILIVVGIVVLAAAGWGIYHFFKPAPSAQPPGNQDQSADWKTYQNQQYKFEIKYPQDFLFNEGGSLMFAVGEFFVGSGTNLVTIGLPKDSYPGTNYVDAFINLSVGDKISEAYCSKVQHEGTTEIVDLVKSKTIDNFRFYRGEADGAAAGTYVKDVIYHAFYNNDCYEATLNIFQGNIGNYPEGTVTQVNEAEILNKLESILATFKVIK
jgi:hypothetical protein